PKGRFADKDVPKARLNKENIKEGLLIIRYVKPYRAKFIAGLFFIALSSATTMAFPYLLKKLIESVQNSTPVEYFTTPGGIAVAMIRLLAVQMIVSFMRVYLFTIVGENAVADMRKDIYNRLITMR